MEYKGKKVRHNISLAEGKIVDFDGKYISVKFQDDPEIADYSFPDCFDKFLVLFDDDASEAAKEAIRNKKEKEADKENNRSTRQTGQAVSMPDSFETQIIIPQFHNYSDFYNKFENALANEIAFLKTAKDKRISIFNGVFVEQKNSRYIYSFETDSELNYPDGTQIRLWQENSYLNYSAEILNCDEFNVLISTDTFFGNTVPKMSFSSDAWRLLEELRDRLSDFIEKPPYNVDLLVCKGRSNTESNGSLRTGQENASRMSLSQPITFIWGPPGTGKTETLADIAIKHMKKGYRVLMLSYSNVSVDDAVKRVFTKSGVKVPGTVIRFGYPKDKQLLHHQYLSAYNYVLSKHSDLLRERDALVEVIQHMNKSSSEYVDAKKSITKIKEKLKEEEKVAVSKASFVGTTISKAVVDSTIYTGYFDTVILDEASMAYIPHSVFAAGLAQKHFICIGDFSQLPPIVLSGDDSILNSDIFGYCGIIDAVRKEIGHKWLCMLNTQYRMHPEIAEFVGTQMYRGLLKSGSDMESKRNAISLFSPFSGDVFSIADLSGMMSVCTKNSDNSRFNVLSALITMCLAVKAAKTNSVGTITPYNAQARLLNAMSRDLENTAPELKKITCATVHQFQGAERDVIIFDAVDCYHAKIAGKMLTETTNNYANRLFNVALTRAKGKIISVMNVDYIRKRVNNSRLIFRRMINILFAKKKIYGGKPLLDEINNTIVPLFDIENAEKAFLNDIANTRHEISIDIPGGSTGTAQWLQTLYNLLDNAEKRGVKITVRTDNIEGVPEILRSFCYSCYYLTDPIAIFDHSIVWYGMPLSTNDFRPEKQVLKTKFRPIFRYKGAFFAQSLSGFLDINRNMKSIPDEF